MSKGIYSSDQQKLLTLLQQVRDNAGLSQNALAERIGRSQSFISKLETGESRLDLLELRQICKAVGISLLDFIKQFEDMLHES